MASDINSVVLVGRLTRDAELKYTSGGTAVCKFAVAVNRRRKSNDQWIEEVSFFDIVLWGRRGEALQQYLSKGTQVAVQGELRQDRWEQNGQKRSKVEIYAQDIQLLGGGSSGGRGDGGPSYRSNQPNNMAAGGGARNNFGGNSNDNYGGGPEEFEDDIPF
jgi:single-strand DNA-binding protein